MEGLCGTRNHDFMHSIVCVKWFPAIQELFNIGTIGLIGAAMVLGTRLYLD